MSAEVFIDGLRDAYRQGEAEGFLLEQHERLTQTTRPIDFTGAGSKVTYHYIHPDSRVRISLYTKGFKINDPNAIIDFGEVLLTLDQQDDEVTPDRMVLNAAQYAMFKYYELDGLPVNEEKRKKFHPRFLKAKTRDLHEVRTSGTAMCIEKAALSHNFTTLGGLPTALATGVMGGIGIPELPHATQLVRADGEVMIFDSANPSTALKNGRAVLVPTLAVVDPYETLVLGKPQAVRMSRVDGAGTRTMDVEFTHTALYPATFEDFNDVGRIKMSALADLSRDDIRRFGVDDAAKQLLASNLV